MPKLLTYVVKFKKKRPKKEYSSPGYYYVNELRPKSNGRAFDPSPFEEKKVVEKTLDNLGLTK